jgi:hypothetical protein
MVHSWELYWAWPGAVILAWQLHDVEVELFYTLHKLMQADALGCPEHICDVVPLLLSCIIGKHGKEVEHHAVIE